MMHMIHKAGDKMYVCIAGKTISIIDDDTGEVKEVQFFIAILGPSQHTNAVSSMRQQEKDFVASVENALRFIEGVQAAIVPSNLKSALIKKQLF